MRHWFVVSFAIPAALGPHRKQLKLSSHIFKVADVSDNWPDPPPIWALDWSPKNHEAQLFIVNGSAVTVRNDSPHWHEFVAEVDQGSVYPKYGYFAPKGCVTNLCNDSEIYSDCCTFEVQGEVQWLSVRTEEEQWMFRFDQETTLGAT